MAVFKAVVHSDYAQIPNETARDTSISFEARGVLAMLLSMPPNWEVHKSWVISQSKAGKDKVNAIFDELTSAGYIRKEEGQRKFGKFSSDDYFVFPTKTAGADFPQRSSRSGSAVNGESATTKETVKQKKEETKETSMSPTGSACSVCGGKAFVSQMNLSTQRREIHHCNHCKGTGQEPTCNVCDGTGIEVGFDAESGGQIQYECSKCYKQEPTCNAGLPVDNSELTTEQPPKADKPLNVPFEDFWNLYGKKVGRKKAEAKWKRLSNKDRAAIMEHLPNYIRNTPDVQYRKNPETYLNSESWNDELPNMGRTGRPDYPENQGVDASIHISQMNPTKPGLRYGEEAQFATVLTDEHKAKNEQMRGNLKDLLKGFDE